MHSGAKSVVISAGPETPVGFQTCTIHPSNLEINVGVIVLQALQTVGK